MQGGVPAWLDEATANNSPVGVPYVVATPPQAAGFVFGFPLRAGHPETPSNKILWVVQKRNGSMLQISGHPVGAAGPTIVQSESPNASPGEIYPSEVDVPQKGCWHFDLTWNGLMASVELAYQ